MTNYYQLLREELTQLRKVNFGTLDFRVSVNKTAVLLFVFLGTCVTLLFLINSFYACIICRLVSLNASNLLKVFLDL